DNISVVRANPELVEAIDAGLLGIDPNRTLFCLPELASIGIGDEWMGKAKDIGAQFFAAQVDAGSNVAPLVAAADLQLAVVIAPQDVKIESLQKHVAEFGVTNAGLTIFHAGPNAL